MDNNSFEYTYCAERQQEIEAIRKKYLPKEEDKMEQLRRLHYSATQKAQAASIACHSFCAHTHTDLKTRKLRKSLPGAPVVPKPLQACLSTGVHWSLTLPYFQV